MSQPVDFPVNDDWHELTSYFFHLNLYLKRLFRSEIKRWNEKQNVQKQQQEELLVVYCSINLNAVLKTVAIHLKTSPRKIVDKWILSPNYQLTDLKLINVQ